MGLGRAEKGLDRITDGVTPAGAADVGLRIALRGLEQVVLFHVREQPHEDRVADGSLVGPGNRDGGILVRGCERRQHLVRVVDGMGRQAELFQIVAALHPVRGFTDLLHGRQQQADKNGDDGNHDQQLDEGEALPHPPDLPDRSGHVLSLRIQGQALQVLHSNAGRLAIILGVDNVGMYWLQGLGDRVRVQGLREERLQEDNLPFQHRDPRVLRPVVRLPLRT